MTVRAGTPADVEAALAVFERSNLERRNGVWPGRIERIDRERQNVAAADSWFFVAVSGTEIVGFSALQPFRSDGGKGPAVPRVCYMSSLYVVPEYWREGIGRSLLTAALGDAAKRGDQEMHLYTSADNLRAQNLYATAGFTRTGRTVDNEEEWSRQL